eukprot:m.19607 g.19607  ORF g.19607 m.19607 type:complete len:232 (-) comp6629_c0_seq1:159-854(-)
MDDFGGFGGFDDPSPEPPKPQPAAPRRKRSARNALYAKSPMQRMQEEEAERELREQIQKEKDKQEPKNNFDDGFGDDFGGFGGGGGGGGFGGGNDDSQFQGFAIWGKQPQQVVIPKFIPRDQRKNKLWDQGKLQKKKADEAILKGRHGDFLIRETARGDRHVVAVNDQGNLFEAFIRHDKSPDGSTIFKFLSREFTKLDDIVKHLERNPLYNKQGLPLYIDKPCRVEQPQE